MKYKKPRNIDPSHKETMTQIGNRLLQLRTEKNISALKLSETLGISRNSYRQMEKGEIYFSIHNLLKVMDYYSLNLAAFVNSESKNSQ